MVKSGIIASIITGAMLAAASLSYFLSAPFQTPGWIVCAVVGAFAVIAVEQT